MSIDVETFLTERNAALRKLDVEWMRHQFPHATSDDVLLAAMHKARYDCVVIEPELRHESGAWLREHNLNGIFSQLLPEGELP